MDRCIGRPDAGTVHMGILLSVRGRNSVPVGSVSVGPLYADRTFGSEKFAADHKGYVLPLDIWALVYKQYTPALDTGVPLYKELATVLDTVVLVPQLQ